jgi:hypothetical protein
VSVSVQRVVGRASAFNPLIFFNKIWSKHFVGVAGWPYVISPLTPSKGCFSLHNAPTFLLVLLFVTQENQTWVDVYGNRGNVNRRQFFPCFRGKCYFICSFLRKDCEEVCRLRRLLVGRIYKLRDNRTLKRVVLRQT